MAIKNTIHCTACGHIVARFRFTPSGRRLDVSEKMQIRILDKEKNKGALFCAECGSQTPFDLQLLDDF